MYKQIREKYLHAVTDNSISIFFSGESILKNADAKYDFAVNHHFYYLTGINREKAVLMLIKANGKMEELLFIERNNELIAKWDGARMSKEEASIISEFEIKNIRYFDEFNDTVDRLRSCGRNSIHSHIRDFYSTLDNKDDLRLNNYINNLKSRYVDLNILNSYQLVTELRMIKNEEEIEMMEKAISITKEGIEALMTNAKYASTENALEASYDYILKVNDVKPSFKTIAASGVNATVLHYHDNNSKINKNDLILFDLGVSYLGYASDISRTFPISGKFTKRQSEIYQIVLDANKKSIAHVKPGMTWAEINEFARGVLFEGLKDLGLVKEREELGKYYYHSLGHYLGLDVHDVGIYSKPLEAGNVITIEPGLYIAEENIGIRIEDDILITEDGCINLSESIIKEISDIEDFMSK